MLAPGKIKRRTNSSFGADGRRINSKWGQQENVRICRAPVMNGLTIPTNLTKKFQRPMMKRRAYDKGADRALKQSSLGQRRRMDGMAKLLARAGRGLHFKSHVHNCNSNSGSEDSEDSEDDKEDEKPFEPLMVWQSPFEGGEAKGLAPSMQQAVECDEFGVEQEVMALKPAPAEAYAKSSVYVPPVLAKWLRPHQREGVLFMYECAMGLRSFDGNGCILADDMGLGKTLQSVTLLYTLLKTGITKDGSPTAKRVIVVCPCSLVKNWDNEFTKWLGPGGVKALALADSDRKTVEKNIDLFVRTKMFNVLIASYECIRTHIARLNKHKDSCDLLICDEAHRLKNRDNQTSRALNSLPCRRRILLTGTPMQNDLMEFYAMTDFTNPGILGSEEEFRRKILNPVLRGKEPDATEKQKKKMLDIQQNMSTVVNEFILRRVNTLNAQHLPPKLVQVVCCRLTDIQRNMYEHLTSSKELQHVMDGKQVNALGSIQALMKLCNHPKLIAEEDSKKVGNGRRRNSSKAVSYNEDEKKVAAAPGAEGVSKFLPFESGGGRGPVHPEWSGKMFVLWRLMREMRKPGNGNDKIVIISNYTQTLDLIGYMCKENSWGFCRLDGSIGMKKRQKMVDEFNDPTSSLVAFLLSSKAGGCGINLIGGNRLVLFDPDWNPAVDKQAAARCWREGQKKRCFTYRFLTTGTLEEKIFQRQLSKEGLQSIVDDKEQVNALSTKDLRNLFKLRNETCSDTHDKLKCQRCKTTDEVDEVEALQVLPKKLATCKNLLEKMMIHEDAERFTKPLNPQAEGVSNEEYDRLIKQPMDLGTINGKLDNSTSSYTSVSQFSKDVNRIFANVMKVWSPGQEIADAARRLQGFWLEEWTNLVPRLMAMKAGDDDNNYNNKENQIHEVKEDIEQCEVIGSALVNNERSDDYREQIGMPDEEDMRSWSHHHTTDTVDDPIFRAAMRGSEDAVSFVFGLEVTWSLIQQRQQDEEEKAAMKALENVPDNDEKNSKVDDNDEDDSSSDSDGEDSLIQSEDERGRKEEQPLEEENDFIESDEDEGGNSKKTFDLLDSDDSDVEVVEEARTIQSCAESVPQSVISDKENEPPVSQSHSVSSTTSNKREWNCSICTFTNTGGRKCTMCDAKKPSLKKLKCSQ